MANNITVKDALSVNQVVKTTDVAGVHTPHHAVDSLPALPIGANHIGSVEVDASVLPTGAATAANQLPDGHNVTVDNAAGASAVNIQDGGNSITVDGSVSLAAALPAGTNNIGDVDVLSVPAPLNVTGGGIETGALRVTIANNSTGVVSVDDNGASLTVDGTVTAAAQPGVDIGDVTINNAAGASAVNVQDGGNSLTVDNATISVVGGGLEATAQRVTIASDSTGLLSVDDNGGSLTVDGTVAVSSLPALVAGTANIGDVDVLTVPMSLDGSSRTIVVGTVAPDSPVGSSSPVQVGVEARTTDGTPVNAAGDLVRPIADTLGKQVVLLGAVHDRHVRGTANYTTTTASDLIAAAGVGVRIVVTSVLVTNAHATVGTKVEIRDGTTVKVLAFAAAAGGGFALSDPHGLFISTANTAVTGRCVTTGSDVDITVSGYTISN